LQLLIFTGEEYVKSQNTEALSEISQNVKKLKPIFQKE